MQLDDTKPDARYPLARRRIIRRRGYAWRGCALFFYGGYASVYVVLAYTHACVGYVVLTGVVVFLKVARRRTLDDRVIQVHVRRRLVLRRERHLHCIISARGSPCMHINM